MIFWQFDSSIIVSFRITSVRKFKIIKICFQENDMKYDVENFFKYNEQMPIAKRLSLLHNNKKFLKKCKN